MSTLSETGDIAFLDLSNAYEHALSYRCPTSVDCYRADLRGLAC